MLFSKQGLRGLFKRRNNEEDQTPLRAALLSVEQMEQHGKVLATTHVLSQSKRSDRLLNRLDENEQVLISVCHLLTVAVKAKHRITPAGEWLLDNFYLIEEQISTARQHFPKGYSRELPRLASGPSSGLPRVYDLALEVISHGDGRVDEECLYRFIAAYQSVTALTLGELWAIPIMLRLALIENLRRVGARISAARHHVNLAQSWANQMMTIAESDPKNLILVIADMARSHPPMVSPFVAEMARRLQGHGPALALPLTWVEQRLAESSQTIEQMVRAENQQQAAGQVSISNTIGSLRFLGSMDWRVFVESMSVVEQILLQDRSGLYGAMDFATRDHYRHVIDRLAKQSDLPEAKIAQLALDLAQQAAAHPENEMHSEHTVQHSHVGYYLIDDGLVQLRRAANIHSYFPVLRHKSRTRLAGLAHGLAMTTTTLLFSFLLLAEAEKAGVTGWQWWTLAALLVLAGSQLASVLVSWLATMLARPHPLPRMNYSRGLPQEMRTLVVIPSMLASVQRVEELLEALEVRYLGNQDAHLHFALLTDFPDANTETLPSDAALLKQVKTGIEKLNARYAGVDTEGQFRDRFFLLHRPRLWNPVARRWMGYERKRGKLAALNLALRGGGVAAFSQMVGDIEALSTVQYVITLDTDTQLPRDSARQFVAAMAHPLNRPRYHPHKRIITGGYGILQPRMAASLTGANRSRYAHLFGSEPGIDPYTRVVSDVYQDIFGEGSFVGKGIYDVDAFETVLKARFPDNRILSHDLLEGCYIRSGLLSDVQLYEDYPARYQADVQRQERWIRGDWQIAQWLLPWVPGFQQRRQRNPLSALSRWKIFDNLRRSMVPTALTLLLLLGWSETPCAWVWTLTVAGILILPGWLIASVNLFRRAIDVRRGYHLITVLRSAGRNLLEAAFKIACLPYEASFSASAIVRSIGNLLFAQRRLLDWNASGEPLSQADDGIGASYRTMAIAPSLALVCAIALWWLQPQALLAATPILLLWGLAPGFAWWLSRPLADHDIQLSPSQEIFLRKTARKTWAFFATFVTADEHWLPPDNFQEQPGPVLAHRTSPTNIGMSLLANLSALDFGFIGVGELLQRTENTFQTLAKLERYQGHFCNWYDTQTLQPLLPRYISSVDSGNLAGHLLTLRAGLLALPDQPLIPARAFKGLEDTLAVLRDALTTTETETDRPTPDLTPWKKQMEDWQILLSQACQPIPADSPPTNLWAQLRLLESLQQAQPTTPDSDATADDEIRFWSAAWQQQCQTLLDDLLWICPWLLLPSMFEGRALLSDTDFPSEADSGLNKLENLDDTPSLNILINRINQWLPAIANRLQQPVAADQHEALIALQTSLTLSQTRALQRVELCDQLILQATEFATLEYEFLYDKSRHLLAVGYNVDEFRRDNSYYDLLASEARLSTFVAIAQGKLPQESWFALGRLLTTSGGAPVLVSWSGSMFEYLMPLLVMPSYAGTLLDQTCRVAVKRQIAYGNLRALPWGVSESGFSTVDASLNYQYHAFGVPGLGLKRGLAEDSVVAPYASALALMVDADAACSNLQRLAADGCEGRYGFYEAIDYTPVRMSRGQNRILVQSFMAHHQGMSLLALGYLLLNQPMQQRFQSDPLFQATLLLLQEKVPKSTIVHAHVAEHSEGGAFFDAPAMPVHRPMDADTLSPEVQMLSNGSYHVMLSNAGGGYSRWNELAVTRWREDTTCDNWGAFVYLRDVDSGEFWSAAHQPTLKRAERYVAMFSEGRAEFRRRDHGYETYSEIVVSPEDDIELRRLRITNRSRERRTIEITSYAEVVLTTPAADANQTAFGNLFVQTEIVSDRHAILCTRRPRSEEEPTPWMFHLLCQNGTAVGSVSYETDRMQFIGRGNTLVTPRVIREGGVLSGSQGSVLDPIVAIRCTITLDAEQSATVDWVTGVAHNREDCMVLVDKYQDRHFTDRVFDIAGTHSAITLRQINASESDAQLYRRLAGSVLYANAALRAEASLLVQNRRGQAGLWGYAISGDLPIVLLKISDISHIELAHQLIQCHAYWRLKGLAVDLVIWNEDHVGYRQQIQDAIMGLIATGTEAQAIDRPGGIFVRTFEQIPNEDRILLQAVARAIIADNRGTLEAQVRRRILSSIQVERLTPSRQPRSNTASAVHEHPALSNLILRNALGGFSADGNEYCIISTPTQTTPLPWANVLANPDFGTVISESGLAYSWSENAHEFRLTPWSDDTVGASSGEAMYLRDEESGQFWSPTPLPCRGEQPYVTRHGFGYSGFEHKEFGIHSTLTVYVPLQDSVKFSVLRLRNDSSRRRRISATGYVEWVLGDLRTKSAPHIVTEIDAHSGALFARNSYNTEFSGRVAFFDVDDLSRTLTADRTEFIGRNGCLARPDAMTRARLSGRVGAALDPCGAIQIALDLAPGEEREIIFRLGAGHDLAHARDLALRLRKAGCARIALEQIHQYWQHTLGTVQVDTPDSALNVLANGWLLYQALACRLWARSGFYQSGGAFGFRDQLQDVMALVHAEPALVREHLLRAAARQYPEGDAQHWWHPPQGRGVRTRCSDDFLWLPLATCHYIKNTGDHDVLDTQVTFINGRPLNADEESYYDLPVQAEEHASLYQHCVRAILNGLRMGEHGLPLMGSGDWNDGMNLVGIHGKGESVWLGFFLHKVLVDFAELALQQRDADFAERCQYEAAHLQRNLDVHGWDGDWYRRAYFDDGTALGSIANSECIIDSIAQSWSVLSGAGEPERSQLAMNALDQRLVRRDAGLVQLLDPPFDKSPMNPGYIKGYVPGVRENGGQYTHAAIWAAMAFAAQGDSTRAWELLALINPINHGISHDGLAKYKAEPYVVAADVYAIAPHTGRGGWTWYTGSASWLYRLMLESLLGLTRDGEYLRMTPCIPPDWGSYSLRYRYGSTHYQIEITQRQGAETAEPTLIRLDGEAVGEQGILLKDDQQPHQVEVVITRATH